MSERLEVRQLSSKHCHVCEMMHRLVGHWIPEVFIEDRPELLGTSQFQTVPIFQILRDGEVIDEVAGSRPLSVLQGWADGHHDC